MLDSGINLSHRLKAAGIIEVIIAMMIICVVMIASSILYSRLMTGTKGMLKIKAELVANEICMQTLNNKSFFAEEGTLHDLSYKKEVMTSNELSGVWHIRIDMYGPGGELVYTLNQLQRTDDH